LPAIANTRGFGLRLGRGKTTALRALYGVLESAAATGSRVSNPVFTETEKPGNPEFFKTEKPVFGCL